MNTATAQRKITATTVDEAQGLLDIVVDELQRHAVEEGTHGILSGAQAGHRSPLSGA